MAADRKKAKYAQLATVHHFIPLAFKIMVPVCAEGLVFISSLGHILSTMSGDARETSYLFQRLVLTIQRFNGRCTVGSIRDANRGPGAPLAALIPLLHRAPSKVQIIRVVVVG